MKVTREQKVRKAYAIGRKDGYLRAVADAHGSKPESLEQYFSRPDTPSRFSPTGITMLRILVKYPEITFEDARVKANQLLKQAAGHRRYRTPAVLSPDEQRKRLERFEARFKSPASSVSGTASTAQSVGDAHDAQGP